MPRNPIDPIQQFVRLRTNLERERESLRNRLTEVERALGLAAPTAAASNAPRRGRPPGSKNRPQAPAKPRPAGAPNPQNKMSMRDAIAKALGKQPLGIKDVVAGMKKLGYRFKSSNPVNSVGAFLYGPEGKKTFVRGKDGLFSIKPGAA
jgi:hypothetical protein